MPLVNTPAVDAPSSVTTASAPVRATAGVGIVGGSNILAENIFDGPAVPALGGGLFLLFQTAKHLPWVDQQKYAHIILLVLGLAVSLGIAIFIAQSDIEQAIYRGCGVAVQAWLDWAGAKVGGLPGLPAATMADKSAVSTLILPDA